MKKNTSLPTAEETSPELRDLTLPGVRHLPGEICAQYICCGKAGCRCQDGEKHGPYHYRIWREGDRVRKAYVRQADLEATRVACLAYKSIQQRLTDARKRRQALSRAILGQTRILRSLQKSFQAAQKPYST